MSRLRVLIVEDSEDDAILIAHHIKRAGWDFDYERVDTPSQMRQLLEEKEWDIILCDYVMPAFSGMDALKLFQEKRMDIPFIIVSGKVGEDVAVEAMKAGANDYILKQNLTRLTPAMERELKDAEVRREKRRAQEVLAYTEERYRLIAENMSELIALLNSSGVIEYASPSYRSISGLSGHQYAGMNVLEQVAPEDQERARQMLLEVYKEKVIRNFELKFITLRGERRHYEVTASPILGPEGNVRNILTVSRDITIRRKIRDELERSEERYRRLVEMSPEPVIVNLDGFITYANSAACEALRGETNEQLLGKPFITVIHPENKASFLSWSKKTYQGENLGMVEQKFICLNGAEINVEMVGVAIPYNDKQALMILFHDITERKKVDDELRLTNKVFENTLEAIVITNHQGIIQSVNPAFSEMTGYSEKEVIGNTPRILKSGKYPLEFYQDLWNQITTISIWQGEIWNRRKTGEIYPEWKTIFAIRDQEGNITNFSALSHDISKEKMQEAEIKKLSNYDMLTGLLNRRAFEKKLGETISLCKNEKEKFALYYLDLDRFKYVNDTLGYLIGDKLLQLVANRLQSFVESQNGMVSRIGGDEFSILLPSVKDRDEAVLYAKNLFVELSNPFFIDDYELFIMASIGISMYPTDGEDAESLLKNTDIALYWAKEHHNDNLQIFTSSMNIETYKTFSLEKDLRLALANNQLELYYQPRVEIKSGMIVGAEALIRWNHPEWGLVSPVEFIPLAEETGLILEIEEWVKNTACQQINKWHEAGLPPIPISINVFAQKFMKQDFLKDLQTILENAGVDGKWIEIEITESFMIQNPEVVRETIGMLKKMGIKISLDDFGTGYSSLSYLTQFSIDILKVDKSFIQDSTTNPQIATILYSIIQMAHGLNMEIVAEGVETEEQLALLDNLHCHYAQGYLFSPPVPAHEFASMLDKKVIKIKPLLQKEDAPFENKRRYFRIDLLYPLSADMTIIKMSGKNIELGKTEVLIEDIGLGGIRFLSHLKLAILKDILYMFETQILGELLQLNGHIVWKREARDNVFQYGVEFSISENDRTKLAGLLNRLSTQLRKSPLVYQTRYIKDDRISYIQSIKSRNNSKS